MIFGLNFADQKDTQPISFVEREKKKKKKSLGRRSLNLLSDFAV